MVKGQLYDNLVVEEARGLEEADENQRVANARAFRRY